MVLRPSFRPQPPSRTTATHSHVVFGARRRRALEAADQVVLIGYSMPRTDPVFIGMFWGMVGAEDIVNDRPARVISNPECSVKQGGAFGFVAAGTSVSRSSSSTY